MFLLYYWAVFRPSSYRLYYISGLIILKHIKRVKFVKIVVFPISILPPPQYTLITRLYSKVITNGHYCYFNHHNQDLVLTMWILDIYQSVFKGTSFLCLSIVILEHSTLYTYTVYYLAYCRSMTCWLCPTLSVRSYVYVGCVCCKIYGKLSVHQWAETWG
jgi:hypothetical protein